MTSLSFPAGAVDLTGRLAASVGALSHQALTAAGLLLWVRDEEGKVCYLSGDSRALTGLEAHEILDGTHHWSDHLMAEDARIYREGLENLREQAQCDVTYRLNLPSGKRWIREWGHPMAGEAGLTLGYLVDVTELKRQQKTADILADHLGILGQTNQAVMRCRDGQSFLRQVCDILTQEGRFEAAWVCLGEAEADEPAALKLITHARVFPALHDALHQRLIDLLEEDEWACRMAARHACPPAPVAVESAPWLQTLLPRAVEMMIFPLYCEGRLAGAFTLVANAGKLFDYAEMSLLTGLMSDICFALHVYYREAQRRHAVERLRLSAKVFENSREGILITDAKRHVVTINRAFSEITGYGPEEIIGKTPKVLSSGLHDENFYDALLNTVEREGGWKGEIWNRRKNGELFPEFLGISAVRDENGEICNYVGIFSDITEQHANRNRLEFLAHHDALTGLPNRILLADRVERALAAARRNGQMVALIFLDLDNFKSINDSLGHQAGDSMLISLVGRIRSCLREMDTLSRLGGDEFVALLPGITEHRAAAIVAEKILAAVQGPIQLGAMAVSSSFSMGIAVFPEHGGDFEALLKNADTAMYHAKERGKNTFAFYEEHLSTGSVVRLALQSRLHGAAERGELHLVYQPQVDIGSGRIIGAEALLRWNSPDFGFVSPGEFIPVAEESGLIVHIGEWVLEEVCRQIRSWMELGQRPVPVAVNISPIQFLRGKLVAAIAVLLERYQIPPAFLDIEITESTMVEDSPQVFTAIQALKDMGLMLSVDDFGTGYSNLGRLRQFNANKLKIDQSFVRALERDDDGIVMVRTIIQMASNLKMESIAEGVETRRQYEILAGLGCQQVQGYLTARPEPPSDFARRMAAEEN